MPGRYLRRKADGPRDPTMTHVDDPHIFKVGNCIRDDEGWSIITKIADNVFGNPDIRFATTEPFEGFPDEAMFSMLGHYDFRPYDTENLHRNGLKPPRRSCSDRD